MKGIFKHLNIRHLPKDKRQDFISNIFLGTMLMLLFIVLENTTVRQNAINRWFDYYIRLRMNGDTDAKRASGDLIFLDLDNKSLRDLGRPNMIPRNKIADLLNFAYQGGAKVVIIDIDFSERDYTPERLLAGDKAPMTGAARDGILFDLLKQIKEDTSSQTKVLLIATTYVDRTQKDNIFSELIDNKKIYAVTPTFTVSKPDNKVRFWMPYLDILENNAHKRNVLWSIPLTGAVLMYGDFDELIALKEAILEGKEDNFALSIKRGNLSNEFVFYRENSKENEFIRDSQHLQYNRIQYVFFPPNIKASEPFGNIPVSRIGHWRKKGLDNKRIDYKGKLVIIGRGDQDCMDFHETPIGRIPGMYVHGNSIATILGETRPRLTPRYKYITIEMFLIIVASFVFLCAPPLLAICIVAIMTGLCWVGTYWYFQLTNEFIYTSFAFAGIWIYRIIGRISTFIRNFLRRKQK